MILKALASIRTSTTALALSVLISALAFTTPSEATEGVDTIQIADQLPIDYTAEQIDEVRDGLRSYNVPEEQIGKLIEKLKEGELWDSIDPQKHPANIEDFENEQEKGTIERFADGSVVVSTLQVPIETNNSLIQPRSIVPGFIRGCEEFFAQGYHFNTNCLAQKTIVLATMSFRFDYYYTVQDAKIQKYYNPSVTGFGMSFEAPTFEQNSDRSVRMSALLSVLFQGFPIQNMAWIQVDVDTDGAHFSSN